MPKEATIGEHHETRRVVEGANLALYTLVVLAIIALANWFVSNHDKNWDLTPNKSYSLSPQTVKILKGLDRDVAIYVFDRKGSLREGRDLLDNYSKASRRIELRYVDPDREPGLSREMGVRTYGTVIVASGERHYEAQGGVTEEAVTNALIRLLKGQKTVYFVQGHGERDLENTERTGYDRVKKQLENENYVVKTVVLLQKMEIPTDCSLLVIAGPQHDYLPQEVDTIRKYVDNGGRLLLMMDAGRELPSLARLIEDWNVTPQNDLAIDQNPVAQIFGTGPEMPLIVKYGNSPIVQPLSRMATLFPFTRSFSISKESKSGVTGDSLCETSPESFGVVGFNPKMTQVSYRPGKDVKGPLTVAVAGSITPKEINSTEKRPEGRFVVLGTSALPSNVYLGFQANRDFFMNSLNWLAAEEDLISIRPKPTEAQHLNLTTAQMGRILYLGVIGLPLLIIVVGTLVWWSRR
jgi:ABC-type uncharacterized transport system involved in gliding motility auxiliary subunit